MTYRYVQLALYPKFKCSSLVAYTRHNEEIENLTPFEELVLWSRKVIAHEIEDSTMYVMLDFDFDEFDNY